MENILEKMGLNIQDNFWKVYPMVKVEKKWKMVLYSKEIIFLENQKEVKQYGKMGRGMTVNSKMGKSMEWVHMIGEIKGNILVNGKKGKWMEKEN